ncbi:unnamed protein product [Camellia sinensis]
MLQSGISSKLSKRKKKKKMEMRRSQDIGIGQDLTRFPRLMSDRDKLVSSLNEEDDGVVLARIRDGEKDARRLGFGMLCSSSNGIEMMENGDCQKCDLTEVSSPLTRVRRYLQLLTLICFNLR